MMVLISKPEDMLEQIFRPLAIDEHEPENSQKLGAISSAARGCWLACSTKIRAFALDCARKGWDACHEKFDPFLESIQSEIDLLGEEAHEVTESLQVKLHAVLDNYVQYASNMIPLETSVHGTTLRLSNLEVSYKVMASGSIGISLESLFKVIGQGEVGIVGTYTRSTEA